jgi:RNA polymerase sigma factor (sigma-70 family)
MKRLINKVLDTGRSTRSVITAVVVGAALSSLPSEKAMASISPQAVNDISRYCQACWRNARLHPDAWGDCTQEVLTRLLQTVQPEKWDGMLKLETEERREFLRAIDAVKKRTQRAKKYAGLIDEVGDRRSDSEQTKNELREELDRVAQEVLSVRQQRILQLSCEGWTIPEIAEELKTTVERISDEKYKAIRKVRRHLEG